MSAPAGWAPRHPGRRGGRLRADPGLVLVWCTLALPALFGCAAVRGGGGPERPAAAERRDLDRAVEALQAAETLYERDDHAAAAATSDSLFQAWRGRPGFEALADRALWLHGRALEGQGLLGPAGQAYERLLGRVGPGTRRSDAARRLVEVRAATGDAAAGVELLLEEPDLLDPEGLETLRRLASGLSPAALADLAARFGPSRRGAAIVHLQLAQLLAAEGRSDSARRVARDLLEAGIGEPEAEIARLIAETGGRPGDQVVRIGAVLPLSGSFGAVGELLRQGLELALEDYRAREGAFRVELLLRDDGSEPERAAPLVQELESEGVVAVVGPLRSESFAASARARANPRLLLISPTATEVLQPAENTYTLFDRERRQRDVAADVAEWVVRELGMRRTSILYPDDPGGRIAASAFGERLQALGAQAPVARSYPTDTTTFQDPIEAVAAAEPPVVFVPAPDPQTVLTLAPQLFYYGLDDAIVIGSEAWSEPAVIRRLEPFASDHRVLGLWVDRMSPGTEWQRFEAAYEREYRESLRGNLLPALSHDALRLVLAALDTARLPIPAALSRALERASEVEGVTGRLRPDPETSTVGRPTIVRMIVDGRLLPAERSELLVWLEEARIRAEREREAREARERGEDPP